MEWRVLDRTLHARARGQTRLPSSEWVQKAGKFGLTGRYHRWAWKEAREFKFTQPSSRLLCCKLHVPIWTVLQLVYPSERAAGLSLFAPEQGRLPIWFLILIASCVSWATNQDPRSPEGLPNLTRFSPCFWLQLYNIQSISLYKPDEKEECAPYHDINRTLTPSCSRWKGKVRRVRVGSITAHKSGTVEPTAAVCISEEFREKANRQPALIYYSTPPVANGRCRQRRPTSPRWIP